jgi:hypothetical protein
VYISEISATVHQISGRRPGGTKAKRVSPRGEWSSDSATVCVFVLFTGRIHEGARQFPPEGARQRDSVYACARARARACMCVFVLFMNRMRQSPIHRSYTHSYSCIRLVRRTEQGREETEQSTQGRKRRVRGTIPSPLLFPLSSFLCPPLPPPPARLSLNSPHLPGTVRNPTKSSSSSESEEDASAPERMREGK